MREVPLLFALVAALAVSGCLRQEPAYYVMDPQTGQPVPVVTQQQLMQPDYAQQNYQPPSAPTYAQGNSRGTVLVVAGLRAAGLCATGLSAGRARGIRAAERPRPVQHPHERAGLSAAANLRPAGLCAAAASVCAAARLRAADAIHSAATRAVPDLCRACAVQRLRVGAGASGLHARFRRQAACRRVRPGTASPTATWSTPVAISVCR